MGRHARDVPDELHISFRAVEEGDVDGLGDVVLAWMRLEGFGVCSFAPFNLACCKAR